MDPFEEGRDALLQALALMRDEEDFGMKYGGVADLLVTRRESSVTALCEQISKLKKEIETRNKCSKLLDDISERWQQMLDDREEKVKRIHELEKEKKTLEEKVDKLETLLHAFGERRGGNCNDRSKDHVPRGANANEEDTTNKNNKGNQVRTSESERASLMNQRKQEEEYNDRRREDSFSSSHRFSNQGNDSNGTDGTGGGEYQFHSRFQAEGQGQGRTTPRNSSSTRDREEDGGDVTYVSQRLDGNYSLITENPYEHLDRSYYNPTQFFQRLSTTTARKGRRRGGRNAGAGGRKKTEDENDVSASASSSAATKKRSRQTGQENRPPRGAKKRGSRGRKGNSASEDPEIITIPSENDSSETRQNEATASFQNEDSHSHNFDESESGLEGNSSRFLESGQDESPDNNFYDCAFATTFFDEHNQ